VKRANTPQHFSIRGKVIEIFQKEGKPVTRVSVDSFYLDVSSSSLLDAHLEDLVVIEGNMAIEEVRNDFTVSPSQTES
jgi:hypothetical protein